MKYVVLGLVAIGLVAACGGSGGGGNPPSITAVVASTGYSTGGTTVLVQGGNFEDPVVVEFDGIPATSVSVVDSTTVRCNTPAHAPGAVDVRVSNDNGENTLAGGYTYVAFPPTIAADTQVDADAGTPVVDRPVICCDATNVYVAWTEPRPAGNSDVFFQSSADRGGTWAAMDVRVNTNAAGASDSRVPAICCSGSTVHLAWADDRSGVFRVHYSRSTDGGATWLAADVPLHTMGQVNVAPEICCDGNNVYVVWADDRNAGAPLTGWDLFVARSTDGGATFQPNVRINQNAGGTTPQSQRPKICCEGSNLYVVWEEARATHTDALFNRSTDAGATWLSTDIRIDGDAGTRSVLQPTICCDQGRLYIGWRDDRNAAGPATGYDVYVRASPNGGTGFLAERRVTDFAPGTLTAADPVLCCEGTSVYVGWTDGRNGSFDVFFDRSTDGGLTFGGDARLDRSDPAGASVSISPQICCNGSGAVHMAWADQRSGVLDIWCNSSDDGGVTWLPADQRMDTDVPGPGNSSTSSSAKQMCCEGAYFYVVWQDDRNTAPFAGYDIAFGSNQ